MAKVAPTPTISKPFSLASFAAVTLYLNTLVRDVIGELGLHADRLNRSVQTDGTETMSKPLILKSYTVAGVPAASAWTSGLIYVSDETGGATLAFSDGTNWRRVQDRSVVS